MTLHCFVRCKLNTQKRANTYTTTEEEGIVLKFLLLLTSLEHFVLFFDPVFHSVYIAIPKGSWMQVERF